jgi:hypothetical protein
MHITSSIHYSPLELDSSLEIAEENVFPSSQPPSLSNFPPRYVSSHFAMHHDQSLTADSTFNFDAEVHEEIVPVVHKPASLTPPSR